MCIYLCNVYLIISYVHVDVFLVIVHVQYCVNLNSAMSILHDGMCALKESTIIIIIIMNHFDAVDFSECQSVRRNYIVSFDTQCI